MLQATRRLALSGSPAIEELQVALRNLAQAAANANWDPGSASGHVSDQTIGALNQTIVLLVQAEPGLRHVTGQLVSALRLAVRHSGARPQAANLIARYAPQLTSAARILAVHQAAGRVPHPPAQTIDPGMLGLGALPSLSRLTALAPQVSSRVSAPTSTRPTAGGLPKTYPAGSVKTDAGDRWRVAIPKAAAQAALSGIELQGGDLVETESVPKTDGAATALPEVTNEEFKKRTTPWYKKWQTWAIAGGAVVVIGGAVIILR